MKYSLHTMINNSDDREEDQILDNLFKDVIGTSY